MTWNRKLAFALLALAVPTGIVRAQGVEENTIDGSREVLRQITAIPAKAIPASLLADAQGVVIIPGMVKGSFIIGARHGKGVLVARNASGDWLAPVFITVRGGSVGLQAGLEATDVVAVFRNREGVDRLMKRKFTIGADASVAAGPVGREASAATDAQLKAEILSYSRSRGLFAGFALDGTSIQVDHRANDAYYRPTPGQPNGVVPESAVKLVEQIAGYANPRIKTVSIREAPAVRRPTRSTCSKRPGPSSPRARCVCKESSIRSGRNSSRCQERSTRKARRRPRKRSPGASTAMTPWPVMPAMRICQAGPSSGKRMRCCFAIAAPGRK